MLAIAVSPRDSGLGVGRSLMGQAERTARERGYPAMHLSVSPSNARAIEFYRRLGWHRRTAADGQWEGIMEGGLA